MLRHTVDITKWH